ncbi:MAG: response regulator [Candidatus Neomarinimicrobiota bacterium]|nr:MAG: response regulator [Candidatus Neomarinimicrobiota bacterium]
MTGKPSVLILEDDKETITLYEKTLGKKYDVHTAVSVSEARQILKKFPIQLVLLDLSVEGDEDGLDLTRQIRADKKWKKIPVIAVTAHAFIQDMKNCLRAGCDEYVAKPYPIFELIRKVDGYLTPAAVNS